MTQQEQKNQVKKCKIIYRPKEIVPLDMRDYSPEEREEYNKILNEESKGTGISIYDYYNLNEEEI